MISWHHEGYCWVSSRNDGVYENISHDAKSLITYLAKYANKNGSVNLGDEDLYKGLVRLFGVHPKERRAFRDVVKVVEKRLHRHGERVSIPEFRAWQESPDPRKKLYARESPSFAMLPAFSRMYAAEFIRLAERNGMIHEGSARSLAATLVQRTAFDMRADKRKDYEDRVFERIVELFRDEFLIADPFIRIRNYGEAQAPRENAAKRGNVSPGAPTGEKLPGQLFPDRTAKPPRRLPEHSMTIPAVFHDDSSMTRVSARKHKTQVGHTYLPHVPTYTQKEMSFAEPAPTTASDCAPSRGASDETPTALADILVFEPSPSQLSESVDQPGVVMPNEKPPTSAVEAPSVPAAVKQGVLALDVPLEAPKPRKAKKAKAEPVLPFKVEEALAAFKSTAGERYAEGTLTKGWKIRIQAHIHLFPDLQYWKLVGTWMHEGGDAFKQEIDTSHVASDAFLGMIDRAIAWDKKGRPPFEHLKSKAPPARVVEFSSYGKFKEVRDANNTLVGCDGFADWHEELDEIRQ